MAIFEYKVVPFLAQVQKSDKKGASEAAEQLQAVINQHAKQGWEFYSIDRVQIKVASGLATSMFGGQEQYIGFDMAIFRKTQP